MLYVEVIRQAMNDAFMKLPKKTSKTFKYESKAKLFSLARVFESFLSLHGSGLDQAHLWARRESRHPARAREPEPYQHAGDNL